MIAIPKPRQNLFLVISALVLIPGLGYLAGMDQKNGIYIFGLIGALGYIFLCITQPFTAFSSLVLLGLTVWFSSIQVMPSISLMVCAGGIFLATWLVRLLSRNITFVAVKEFWHVGGMAVAIVISTLFNWGGPAGFVPVFSYIQLLLLVVLVINLVNTPARLQQIGNIFITASALTAGLIILHQWGLMSVDLIQSDQGAVYYAGNYQVFSRSGGIFGDPNIAAFQLTIALPFVFEYWTGTSKSGKVWLVVVGIGILLAFSYTVSMGGLVGLISMLAIRTLLVRRQNFFIRIAQVTFIGFVGFWLTTQFLPDYYVDRILVNMEQITNFLQTQDKSLFLKLGSARGDAWQANIQSFWRSPVIGNGPGNSYYLSTLNSVLWHPGPQLAAHNFLLSIAGDLGILGLFFFAMLLLSGLWIVRPFRSDQLTMNSLQSTGSAVFIALLACVIQGMALDIHVQKVLWVLLGMSLAYKQINGRQNEKKMAGC